MSIQVKVTLSDSATLPAYARSGDAGMDLVSTEEVFISSGRWKLVKTGLCLELPDGLEAQVRPRSGMALKHGVTVLNSPGTIDSGYRGEVGVILINHGNSPFVINKGDRIAQLVFAYVANVDLIKVEALSDSDRGTGGFGSTGVYGVFKNT